MSSSSEGAFCLVGVRFSFGFRSVADFEEARAFFFVRCVSVGRLGGISTSSESAEVAVERGDSGAWKNRDGKHPITPEGGGMRLGRFGRK